MNRYQIENALFKIDGYYTRTCNEAIGHAFKRAQAECLKNLEQDLENVRDITFSDWMVTSNQPEENVGA